MDKNLDPKFDVHKGEGSRFIGRAVIPTVSSYVWKGSMQYLIVAEGCINIVWADIIDLGTFGVEVFPKY